MWRIVRFLRVIGDARINSGKQDLASFIEWGNKTTGLSKSMVYHQLFPAHQGIGPGYATTYAIIGESMRQIQNKALRSGKKLRDFNSYACSMGFQQEQSSRNGLDRSRQESTQFRIKHITRECPLCPDWSDIPISHVAKKQLGQRPRLFFKII